MSFCPQLRRKGVAVSFRPLLAEPSVNYRETYVPNYFTQGLPLLVRLPE